MAWYDGVIGSQMRVLIAPSSCSEQSDGERGNAVGHILSLRHPKSGTSTSYIFRNGLLLELHWFKQAYGSWFLGDYVSQDGGLFISTPFDPIFLFLPIFEEARMKKSHDQGMFRELNEILFVNGYPSYQHLLAIAQLSMPLVCEVKEIGSSKFYRLDDSKVLAWLCCKINNLKATLLTLDKNFAARDDSETLNDAVSLLSEYIDESWLKALCDHIKLDMDDVMKKTPRREILPAPVEEGNPPSSLHNRKNSKQGNEKSLKKSAVQVESKNIRNMFVRAAKNSKRNVSKG